MILQRFGWNNFRFSWLIKTWPITTSYALAILTSLEYKFLIFKTSNWDSPSLGRSTFSDAYAGFEKEEKKRKEKLLCYFDWLWKIETANLLNNCVAAIGTSIWNVMMHHTLEVVGSAKPICFLPKIPSITLVINIPIWGMNISKWKTYKCIIPFGRFNHFQWWI